MQLVLFTVKTRFVGSRKVAEGNRRSHKRKSDLVRDGSQTGSVNKEEVCFGKVIRQTDGIDATWTVFVRFDFEDAPELERGACTRIRCISDVDGWVQASL
jgi:hypothetical protein